MLGKINTKADKISLRKTKPRNLVKDLRKRAIETTMIENLLFLSFSLFLVVKGATLATKYSAKLAESFNFSRYIIGFVVIAFISILPETFIAINSALKGIPEFGLGTLFGSNIADLTLIFAILIILAGRGMKIESKVLKLFLSSKKLY